MKDAPKKTNTTTCEAPQTHEKKEECDVKGSITLSYTLFIDFENYLVFIFAFL